MINYKDFNFNNILDRTDLVFCPYIASLDIQYSHYLPYLWTFCFDSTGEVVFGRSFNDLIEFLEIMRDKMHFSDTHKLVIIVPNLSEFFGNTKKILSYDPEPFVAKSSSEILLAQIYGCYQLHCYYQYSEKKLDDELKLYGIYIPDINHDNLSSLCTLEPDEENYSANRVLYICNIMRMELDMKYQALVNRLPLTKTARITRLIKQEQRRQSNDCNCNIEKQIIKMSPFASKYGMEAILPFLYKAFFGGVSFYEDNVLDKSFDDVYNADLTSAYNSAMILHKFPMSVFKEIPPPSSIRDLIGNKYKNYAMLIAFTVEKIEVKPESIPFLPSMLRHSYQSFCNEDEPTKIEETSGGARIKKAENLTLVLTDVDFKLLIDNYVITGIKIHTIYAARYGYLPDYILKIIIRMYSDKFEAKKRKLALEKIGKLDFIAEAEYDNIKSEIARLYGIFTQSPYIIKYAFNCEAKEAKIIDKEFVSEDKKYSPVLYQWGVWTTAHVRSEILKIRKILKSAPKELQIRILSGDTDCVNFSGDAKNIISIYNKSVKDKIIKRAIAIGDAGAGEAGGHLRIPGGAVLHHVDVLRLPAGEDGLCGHHQGVLGDVGPEGDVGEHAGEQTGNLRRHHQGDGVELGLDIGRPLHGADGGGEALARRADADIGQVADGELRHQRLRHGDRHLHLVRPVDHRQGQGVGDEAVLHRVHGHQRPGDGGDDVASGVHVLQSQIQLLQAAFGVLDAGLQLGEGGVPPGHGGAVVQLRLVHLQLGGGADLKEGAGVLHVVRRQLNLFVQNRLLVLIALDGGAVADPGGVVARQGAAQLQGAEDVPRLHQVAGAEVDGGALGGAGNHDGGLVVGGDLPGDLVLRGDGAGKHRLHLNGHSGGGSLDLLPSAAGGQGQKDRGRQNQRGHAVLSHIRSSRFNSRFRAAPPSSSCYRRKTGPPRR